MDPARLHKGLALKDSVIVVHAEAMAYVGTCMVLLGNTRVDTTQRVPGSSASITSDLVNNAIPGQIATFFAVAPDSYCLGKKQASNDLSVPIACTCQDWLWRGYACQRSVAAIAGCKHMVAVQLAMGVGYDVLANNAKLDTNVN